MSRINKNLLALEDKIKKHPSVVCSTIKPYFFYDTYENGLCIVWSHNVVRLEWSGYDIRIYFNGQKQIFTSSDDDAWDIIQAFFSNEF